MPYFALLSQSLTPLTYAINPVRRMGLASGERALQRRRHEGQGEEHGRAVEEGMDLTGPAAGELDRKSTRLNSVTPISRMPSSACKKKTVCSPSSLSFLLFAACI